MDGEAKDNHLEGVSLLSASLAPGVKYVPAKVEVTQAGLGGAHCFAVFIVRSSSQTVSILSPSCSPQAQSQDALPPRTSRVKRRHRTLKALEMSNLIITSGSEGSELSALYMAERILAQWEAPSWRPAVCRNFSYVDVNIFEIGPLTAAAARLARQRRQLSQQMIMMRPADASFDPERGGKNSVP